VIQAEIDLLRAERDLLREQQIEMDAHKQECEASLTAAQLQLKQASESIRELEVSVAARLVDASQRRGFVRLGEALWVRPEDVCSVEMPSVTRLLIGVRGSPKCLDFSCKNKAEADVILSLIFSTVPAPDSLKP
jgi:hypothetical protein